MRMIFIPLVISLLCGCAEQKYAVLRLDGQSIAESPRLQQAYETDVAICNGETQKANLSKTRTYAGGLAAIAEDIEHKRAAEDVMTGCMAQKGYVRVPEEQADAKKKQIQAVAQMKGDVATASITKAD